MDVKMLELGADAAQVLAAVPLRRERVDALAALDVDAAHQFEHMLQQAHADVAFALRLLHRASTSTRRIASLNEAMLRVGVRGALALVLSDAPGGTEAELPEWEQGLRTHAVLVAGMMRRMALMVTGERIDPQEAYVLGLVHDVGRFVLARTFPEAFQRIEQAGWESDAELEAAERAAWGESHAAVSQRAVLALGLPERIADAAAGHGAEQAPVGGLGALLGDVDRLVNAAERHGDAWLATPEARDGLAPQLFHRYNGGWTDIAAVARNSMAESRRLLTAPGSGG